MKYKVRITKQPRYQVGGEQDDQQQQLMQIIQTFAQLQGVDPKIIMQKLQQLQPEEQQQAIQQMMQAVQQGQQQDGNPQEEQIDQMAAYGGQMGYALDLGSRRLTMNQDSDNSSKVSDSMEEVPREEANIEAEDGETALIPYKEEGNYIHKKITGNKHTEGGVPLNVPEGTFIYSDTKKMKLGGPVLQMFGKSEKTTKKFTPATLAKQYDINKYKAIIDDDKSDPIKKRTAELMIQNLQKKLAQLALVQESKKGFPQGIPEVARSYYEQMQQAAQVAAPSNQSEEIQEQGEQPQAKYGGGLDVYQNGNEVKYNGKTYKPLPSIIDVNNEGWNNDNTDAYNYYSKNGTPGNSITPNIPSATRGKIDPNSWKKVVSQYAPQGATLEDLKKQGHLSDITNPNVINYWKQFYKNPSSNAIPELNYYSANNQPLPALNYNRQPEFNSNYFGNINPNSQNIATTEPPSTKQSLSQSKTTIPEISNNQTSDDNGWSNVDKLSMLNSLINMAGIKKTTPFEPSVKLNRAETYYTDPNRALAANAEQANVARQSANMFAGPQSRYSFNNGQFGANAANIISQYTNQNVGIANQAAQQNTAINNQQMQYDVQRAKRLYDAGVIGEQQYQNAIREARAAVLQSYIHGEENATNRFNLNATESPYFGIDKKGRIKFNSANARTDMFNNKDKDNNPYFSMIDKLMSPPYNMSSEKAADVIGRMYGKQKQSD